jgi:Holliday junction resolvasome RuvABC endonuclease subunit
MFQKIKRPRAILAVYADGFGLSHAILNNPKALVAWGLKRATGDKNMACLREFVKLLSLVKPDVVVLEDIPHSQKKQRSRIYKLIAAITEAAINQDIPVHFYSRKQIQEAFAGKGAKTKHQISTTIGEVFSKLKSSVPPKRRPWEPEQTAISYFTAISLALTHFHFLPNPD